MMKRKMPEVHQNHKALQPAIALRKSFIDCKVGSSKLRNKERSSSEIAREDARIELRC